MIDPEPDTVTLTYHPRESWRGDGMPAAAVQPTEFGVLVALGVAVGAGVGVAADVGVAVWVGGTLVKVGDEVGVGDVAV